MTHEKATIITDDPRIGKTASVIATGVTGIISMLLRSDTETFCIQTDEANGEGGYTREQIIIHPYISEMSDEDRSMLLSTFQQFRANFDEKPEDDYSNRNEIEQKLQRGGELTYLDLHILKLALDNELPANEQWRHLVEVLGYRLSN